MSLRAVLCVLVVCAGRRAWADRAVHVAVDDGVPFAADDLAAALRVRLAPTGAPIDVRIAPDGDTGAGVVVLARGAWREVALDGRTGPDAARLVALVASDLLLDDLARAPVLAPAPIAIHADAAGPAEDDAARPEVGVLGTASAWSSTFAGAAVDVTVPRGSWLISAELGGAGLAEQGVGLDAAVLRVGGGLRFGAIDLRAGGTFAPTIVRTGVGDASLLVGAHASVRVRQPLGGGWSFVVVAGVDAFATRNEYHADGMPLLATPWVAPWIEAGAEWAR